MSQIIMKVISFLFVFLQFSQRGDLTISALESRRYKQRLQEIIAPNDVKAILINDSAVQIEWTESDMNILFNSIKGYNIYIRNVDDEKTEKITINNNMVSTSNDPNWLNINQQNYTINNLKPYTWYKVWVNAYMDQYDEINESNVSRLIDIRTDVTGPSAPLILNVSCRSNNSIYIQWQSPAVFNHTVDHYYVYYRTENKEFKEMVVIAKPIVDNNLLHEDLIINDLIEGKEYEVKVQGATRSVKKSGLIFRGEFSECKKIKLQLNSTILEPKNKTNKYSIDSNLPRFVSKGEVKEVRDEENIDLKFQDFETKINNIETLIHEKFDELLKLSDTINRIIKRIVERTIGSIFDDFHNSTLWDD